MFVPLALPLCFRSALGCIFFFLPLTLPQELEVSCNSCFAPITTIDITNTTAQAQTAGDDAGNSATVGIVLGISIPIVLIIFVVILVLAYKRGKSMTQTPKLEMLAKPAGVTLTEVVTTSASHTGLEEKI